MSGTRAHHDFQKTYQEYYPQVVGYLRQMVGAADAEDLAQEVFLKVNRSIDGFRGDSRISTWIFRIARNAAIDRLRSASAKPVFTPGAGSQTDVSAARPDERESLPQDDRFSPAAILARLEMNECIRGMVRGLPDNYRSVLILTEFEGLSAAEAAASLGISTAAAKIRLHRARAHLREDMNDCCSFSHDECNEMICQPKEALP